MTNKFVYLDFEFHGIKNRDFNLVSVAAVCTENAAVTFQREFWLHDKRQHEPARRFFKAMKDQGFVFVAYVMEAEARSLMTLFGENFITNLKAIDIYLEYRCLLNHNHSLSYGEQYIDGEVIKTTPPPGKYEYVPPSEEDDAHHKPSFSLAAATFKLLGIKIDTVEKNDVRDIIIRGDYAEIDKNRQRIQAYNMSDIQNMPRLLYAVYAQFHKHMVVKAEWMRGALLRGEYSLATAKMIRLGYPVNRTKIDKFIENVPHVLNAAAESCIKAGGTDIVPFRYDKKKQSYVMNQVKIREWAKAQDKPYWRKTDKNSLSISKDAFFDWYNQESEGFPGAFCAYLRTKQSMNGFMPGGKKGKFTDFIGSDGRVRPYFGIYGSQSSRSQPGATGFLPLKAYWMRNFIEAPKGYAITGIDYASQEFLIAAVLSQDRRMIQAYKSGDVYIAFARDAKLVPPDATKQSHKKEREKCKRIVLGISYDMTAKGLAPRIESTEDEAQNLIDTFYDVYPDYADWKREISEEYEDDGKLSLPDGWTMWGDNKNSKSVGNFPIQGHGAVIMREAVKRCQAAGLHTIYTLHDAVYIHHMSSNTASIETLRQSMQDAYRAVMSGYGECPDILMEGDSWSQDYSADEVVSGIHYMKEFVDDRARTDLNMFRQFFT